MARPRFRLRLTPAQMAELETFLKIKHLPMTPDERRIRKRARAIWCAATQNWSAALVAADNNVTEWTFWRWVKIYRQKGLAGLIHPYR